MPRSIHPPGWHCRAAIAVSLSLWLPPAWPQASTPAAKPTLSVNLVAPQAAEWPLRLAANGNIAAWQEAVIGAEAAGLRLTEVLVNVGDTVRKGQPLARLNSETLAADVAQTQAALAEARAAAEEAQANGNRARELGPTGVISAQLIQQWLTAEKTAAARVEALKARLAADRLRLSQTRVLAPDHGVVSARIATIGAVVQPGQELFRIIRGGRVAWRAEVNAADLARLKPGARAQVTPAGGRTIQGRVRVIAPSVDASTRNGLVYVDLPVPGDARAGMFASGEFEIGAAKALTLPQGAVVLRDGFSYVLRVDAASKVIMTKVEVGRRVGERIEIVAGLDSQARVVAAGGGFLSDGDTVRVVDVAAGSAPVATPTAAKR